MVSYSSAPTYFKTTAIGGIELYYHTKYITTRLFELRAFLFIIFFTANKGSVKMTAEVIDEDNDIERESCCKKSSIQLLLRLYSMLTALCLIIMSLVGFLKLGRVTNSLEGAEAITSTACLSFLGISFGILLFLTEMRWKWFFVHFGFLRFRFGRAVIYGITGTMTSLIGKLYNDECDCSDYTLLILVGVACLFACLLQLIGIFFFGPATSPPPNVIYVQSEPQYPEPQNFSTPRGDTAYVQIEEDSKDTPIGKKELM